MIDRTVLQITAGDETGCPREVGGSRPVIDGAAGARFSTYLAGLMTDIRKLVL